MKKIIVLCILSIALWTSVSAQTDKDDRREELQEKQADKKNRAKDKTDYNLFRRQMLSLKEYAEERRKIPTLQKNNKTTVKIAAVVDTNESDADSKTLTGYIVQQIGDNSTNMYEVTYNRAEKKIIAVKFTAEAKDADKEMKEDKADADEEKTEKKAAKKKTKDDDDDGDDDDKPAKEKDEDKE